MSWLSEILKGRWPPWRPKPKPSPGPVVPPPPVPPPTTDNRLLAAINGYRAKFSIKALTENAKLTKGCADHAAATYTGSQFPHQDFALRAAGFASATENWLRDSRDATPEASVDMWSDSPGHERNMRANDSDGGAAMFRQVAVSMTGTPLSRTSRAFNAMTRRTPRVAIRSTRTNTINASSATLVWSDDEAKALARNGWQIIENG